MLYCEPALNHQNRPTSIILMAISPYVCPVMYLIFFYWCRTIFGCHFVISATPVPFEEIMMQWTEYGVQYWPQHLPVKQSWIFNYFEPISPSQTLNNVYFTFLMRTNCMIYGKLFNEVYSYESCNCFLSSLSSKWTVIRPLSITENLMLLFAT